MSKYHIPIIAEVKANSMEEARQIAYRVINQDLKTDKPLSLAMADDTYRAKNNQRIFILHPPDTDAEYDQDAYEAKLAEQE